MSAPQFSDEPDRGSAQARARAIEKHFLGSAAELTREEVVEASGVDLETSRRLWRALGFVDVEEGVPSFSSADVDALLTMKGLLSDQQVPAGTREAVARAMGQAMSHLVESQVDAISEQLAARPELAELAAADPDAMFDLLLQELTPIEERLQSLLLYAWKRHLVAATTRAFSAATGEQQTGRIAVGFADVVGWTALTRDIDETGLAALVEHFEAVAFNTVAGAGGRVVKVIGDEVMFTAPTPAAAAEAGLRLLEDFGGEDRALRVGIAWGPALMRGGDVFGSVVNLASRCTGIARPGTLLADRAMARELAEDGRWTVRRIPTRSVRGYDHLEASVIRRAPQSAEVVAERG